MISPASTYVMAKYGNLEMVKTRNGEIGVVRLPDGKLYEEWYIYYKEVYPDKPELLKAPDRIGKFT